MRSGSDTSPSVDDQALVARCVDGDRSAQDALVGRFGRLVYATIVRTHGRHDRAAPDEARLSELFANVFIALIEERCRRLAQWDGRCSLASWVRLVAASTTLDNLRAEQRASRGRTFGVDLEALPLDGPDALDRALLAERIVRLEGALQHLSEPDRLLLELLYQGDLSPGDIASRLHIAPGALYTRKNRALERLRKAFFAEDESID